MQRRVVITGCGVVSPVGSSVETFWNSLVEGKNGIGKITHFDASGFDSQIAGQVNDFVPSATWSPKDARRTARFVHFAVKAAEEAIADSGFDINSMDPFRVGTIVGSGIGSLEVIERDHKALLEKGPQKISPFLIPTMITNEAAGNVAINFKLQGVNYCPVTACASGAHAIGESYLAIKYGRADIMVCGGTEACLVPLGVGGFCALKALCTRNDEPLLACRPFDRDRSGFIMAEGAGIIILEDLESAKKRGAKIYGEIAGYGATCDAYHITAPNPTGASAARGIINALKESGISTNQPIYVNAHGTSTQLNDKMETNAIKTAFGSDIGNVRVSSTKSMTGHTLGAAGAIECIAATLAVKNKVIPPTINYTTPDPECDLDYTPNVAREVNIKVALSNSLGFGGHNATLLVKEYK